jgi:3-phosphoshikimate 1-carboxyvinyltransferase
MACELSKMGIRCEQGKDYLKVWGGKPKWAKLNGWKDHRIVMALSVASLTCGAEIEDAEVVSVSYPSFFDDMRKLGADIKEVR